MEDTVDALEEAFMSVYTRFTSYLESKKVYDGSFSSQIESANKLIEATWDGIMSGGGPSTYEISEIKDILFEGDTFNGIPNEPNVLIVGGGPNGLFMALVLRLALPIDLYPNLHISVLENRVNENGYRTMTRTRVLTLNFSNITKKEILEGIRTIAPRIFHAMRKGEGDKIDLAQPIRVDPDTIKLRAKGGISYEELLTPRTYRTNVLEYELAVEAQKRGVNIYHDNQMDTFEQIREKYTNDKTLCLFDATGGRLFHSMEGFVKIRDDERNGHAFTVYEGFSPVKNAIKKVDNLLVVGIGETVIKVDFHWGKGLSINWILILYYVLSFTEIYKLLRSMGRFNGGKRRTRRHYKRHRQGSRKHR